MADLDVDMFFSSSESRHAGTGPVCPGGLLITSVHRKRPKKKSLTSLLEGLVAGKAVYVR